MIKNIMQIWNSAWSRRWHSNPDMSDTADNLAEHQWTVAMIALHLKPDCSKELLVEALTHDVGEMVAGDLSYDFKINNPEIAEMHKKAENEARGEMMDMPIISGEELSILKISDWLSSLLWVAKANPDLLNRQDWVDQIQYFKFESLKYGASQALKINTIISMALMMAEVGYSPKINLGWKFDKGLEEYAAAN